MKQQGRSRILLFALGALLPLISAVHAQQSTPPALPASSAAPDRQPEARGTQLYVYPGKGQSPEQTERDRYECYVWAVDQTGFDPSQPQLAPHQRVEVLPAPPSNVIPGAVAGAVIGAVVSKPRRGGEGASSSLRPWGW